MAKKRGWKVCTNHEKELLDIIPAIGTIILDDNRAKGLIDLHRDGICKKNNS